MAHTLDAVRLGQLCTINHQILVHVLPVLALW